VGGSYAREPDEQKSTNGPLGSGSADMLSPMELAALVTATKGAVDILDKVAGQIKSVLLKRPKEEAGGDDRWRYKIRPRIDEIVVSQDDRTVQVVSAAQLSEVLRPNDVRVIQAYERNMEKYFRRWEAVYDKRDSSQDPLANAIIEEQLTELIRKMKGELLGILEFLQKLGVNLDDHYMHVRHLIENVQDDRV